jgi:hypothetical protein
MVKPPLWIPGPTAIFAPSDAALSASTIAVYGQPLARTVKSSGQTPTPKHRARYGEHEHRDPTPDGCGASHSRIRTFRIFVLLLC